MTANAQYSYDITAKLCSIYSNMSWLKNDNSGKNGNIKKYLLEDTNKLHNVLLLEKNDVQNLIDTSCCTAINNSFNIIKS